MRASARPDLAGSGGNGQILMRSIQWSCPCVEQRVEDEDSEEGRNGERVCDVEEETVNPNQPKPQTRPRFGLSRP